VRGGASAAAGAVLGAGLILTGAPAASAAGVPAQQDPAQQDPAQEEIEWSVAPADDDGPDGRVSLRHTVDPGATAQDAIAVTNHSSVEATFQVAAGQGVVGQDGVFDVVDGGAGSWVSIGGLSDADLTLAAGASAVLPVTIRVPSTATPGDHACGIVVGLTQGAGVTVTHRVGVRLHLRVSGEVAPALQVKSVRTEFTGSWKLFETGQLRVDYVVANTGNTRLGGVVDVRATGPWGLGPARADAPVIEEILPGEEVSGSVVLSIGPLFRLTGAVEVLPTVVGADEVSPPGRASAGFDQVAVPWAVLTVALVAAVIIVLTCLSRRRRRRAPGRPTTV
jgi:hypothetical protein